MRRAPADPAHPGRGAVIAGRFRVERVQHLGDGHSVPVARDRESGEEVTLKVGPAADPSHSAVHAVEVNCLSRVRHPNVARLVGHGVCDASGLRYLALEHVAGLTLQRLLDLHAPISPPELRVMGLGLAAALAEIHRRGIVLGGALDGPDVVVGWDLGMRRPVITGFGRATLGAGRLEDGGARADVRAVGVLLHRMLFGTEPDVPPLRLATGWSSAVRDVVARSLADDPRERPANGGVLAREIALALGG